MTDNPERVVEIFLASRVGGRQEYYVAVNEDPKNEEEYCGTIWWNGASRDEAHAAARELSEDYEAPIDNQVPNVVLLRQRS